MISIIIPTLNESENLRRLLSALSEEDVEAEIIVADGGSADDTVATAIGFGAAALVTAPGRGGQIATAVAHAHGDIFLFLHADSLWPPGGLGALRRALDSDPDTLGGNFRLVFDGDDAFSIWLNGFYAKIRKVGIYYGDSGLFVRAAVYHKLGGFRRIALMEDYDFVRKLEKAGRTVCIGHPPLVTSSRRFRNRRPMAIVSGWIVIHVLYYFGVSPDILSRLYRSTAH